ncbi:TolC family protein [Tunturibacter empetritectus]|uniref:Outer membrane protein TolC n=1 Tax=Tunturiibacter lichenicola TaxID=2051959 RepID=A0A7W8N500_9BACT|nr:TolC family protein [Edaphobacter lichenicola]MBB5345754.1 outer membrane protein TolC [Edaphobacter lichenicola]
MIRLLRQLIACSAVACAVTPAIAQISFTSAVGLALKNSPKVLTAQADVNKAQAALDQLIDAFVPNVVGASSIGPPSYGFPLGQPSIYNLTAQSLVFSYPQRDYIRGAKASLEAAGLALKDVREAVTEDTAITYLALHRDLQRQTVLQQQQGFADHLVSIVEDRLTSGQDTPLDLTTARLTAAQIHLARLRVDDEAATDQAHLARLLGLPPQGISTSGSSVPALTGDLLDGKSADINATLIGSSPAVESAFANARSKREIAFGENRYLWRPQIVLQAQYSRFAKFNNLQDYYFRFQQNNAAIGVQITIPFFDVAHKAKAREADADAAHAQHEADSIRDQFFDSRLKIQHAVAELAVRAEIATLDQQLAQQNLDVLLVQLNTGNGNMTGTQMTPKDEQTSRIAEREKFLAVLNANFELQQAQINLMRESGDLESWISAALQAQPVAPAKP